MFVLPYRHIMFGVLFILFCFSLCNADVHAVNQYGETPLHKASKNNDTYAAKTLISKGADINAKDLSGWTPLHRAVFEAQKEMILLLSEEGADLNAKDLMGWTPLHLTVSMGNTEIAQLLIFVFIPGKIFCCFITFNSLNIGRRNI